MIIIVTIGSVVTSANASDNVDTAKAVIIIGTEEGNPTLFLAAGITCVECVPVARTTASLGMCIAKILG